MTFPVAFDRWRLCDRFVEIVAHNLHHFESFDPTAIPTCRTSTAIQDGAINRYLTDYAFHAKVDSMVAQLLQVVEYD